MKKYLMTFFLIFFWICPVYGKHHVPTKKKTIPPKTVSTKTVEKEEPFSSIVVVEADSGRIFEEYNPHLKWPPASVTKLMLASIVMERVVKGSVKLTDRITVSKKASQMGGSQVFLKQGESFTLEELMKAVLVASGNDASYAVAEFIAGSAEAFVNCMNEKAKALNMADTEFHSVHGLPPSKGQKEDLISAHDLAILSREILKYPKVLEWTSIETDTFRDGTFIMRNHNKLLGKIPGMDGLKTGFYYSAGYNIVATAKKGDLRLIVVVLGSPKAKIRDQVVMERFKKYMTQYTIVTVLKKGEVINKNILIPDGKITELKGVAANNFSYLVPIEKKSSLKKEINLPEKIKGEIKEGQKLGELIIQLDNVTITNIDILSPVAIPKASIFTRFFRKIGF